jgi:hypothetical protein
VCGKCGASLGRNNPVFLQRFGAHFWAHGAVPFCSECNGSIRPYDCWHCSPCDACGRQVHVDHFRNRRRMACSVRCRVRIETRQRLERRQQGRREAPCAVCGRSFVLGRTDAVTCSARCRQKRWRQRHASGNMTTITDNDCGQVATSE